MENNKYKKLTLNTIIFAIGSLGSKVFSFLLVPLYTNVLSQGEYGTSDLIISISNLLLPIISLSIGEAVLFYGLKDRLKNETILKNGLLIWLLGAIGIICLTPILNLYQPLKGFAIYTSLYTIFLAFRLILQLYTKANEKNVFFSIDSIIHAILLCSLNILFLLVFKLGILGYLLSLLISEIVSAIILFSYNRGYRVVFKIKIDKEYLLKMIKYSAPLILNSISWAISHSTDKIMLEAMVSIEAVGIYSVASKIPTLVNTVTNFFCQAWTMSAILEFDNKDKHFYKKTFSMFSMLLCISISFILMVLRPFMNIYVGKDFRVAWMFVPLLLIAALFQNFSGFFGSIIQSAKKNNILLLTSLFACTINVVLNLLLIPRFGVQGAVIGTLGSYVVAGSFRMIVALKTIHFDIKFVRLYFAILILVLQSILVVFEWNILAVSLNAVFCISIVYIKEIKDFSRFMVRFLIRRKKPI